MKLCERCGQAAAVVTVTQLTLGVPETAAIERHLCNACEREERIAIFGPPPQSALGGAERFRPLHTHALQLLAELHETYEVTRSETFPSSPSALFPANGLEALATVSAMPPVLLTPRLPEAAPLGVVFTSPPALVVRCGRWHEAMFGAAIHADDDMWTTSASESERLNDLVGKVVDGLFAEEVKLPLVGAARLSVTFGDGTSRAGLNGEGWMTISRAHARALVGAGPRAVRWRPWPRRRK